MATVTLHETVGPLRTTVKAVAERDAVRALLMRGRPERGRRRVRVAAAIGHAVDFGAWRSLARGDLDDMEIVELMVELVRAAGASRGKLR